MLTEIYSWQFVACNSLFFFFAYKMFIFFSFGRITLDLLSMESPPQGQTEVTKSKPASCPLDRRGRCSPGGRYRSP